MQIRKATINDLNLLIRLRIDYLLDEGKLKSIEDKNVLEGKLRSYFGKWIPIDGFVAYIAEKEKDVLSTAFLSIVERPPRMASTSYLIGTIYNVFTYPQHRRKGIATSVMQKIIEEAGLLGVAKIDLLATNDGKHLYEKIGFQDSKYTPMWIKP